MGNLEGGNWRGIRRDEPRGRNIEGEPLGRAQKWSLEGLEGGALGEEPVGGCLEGGAWRGSLERGAKREKPREGSWAGGAWQREPRGKSLEGEARRGEP